MFFYNLFHIIFFLPLLIMYPTKVIGRKNLPKGGAIYICNHQSYADVAVLGNYIFRSQYFLAKKELFAKGFLKWFLKTINVIPIDRQNPELSSIKKCLQVLKNDKILTVFPQGTRKNSQKMEGLKDGVIMFGQKSQKPIVPMWFEKKPKIFSLNRLHIGKPIYLTEIYNKKCSPEELVNAENKILLAYQEFENFD